MSDPNNIHNPSFLLRSVGPEHVGLRFMDIGRRQRLDAILHRLRLYASREILRRDYLSRSPCQRALEKSYYRDYADSEWKHIDFPLIASQEIERQVWWVLTQEQRDEILNFTRRNGLKLIEE